MHATRFAVACIGALLTLSGCLTPSMGRGAETFMGGSPSRYPVSVRDTPTAQLVGRSFDGASTEGWIIVDRPAPGEPAPRPSSDPRPEAAIRISRAY